MTIDELAGGYGAGESLAQESEDWDWSGEAAVASRIGDDWCWCFESFHAGWYCGESVYGAYLAFCFESESYNYEEESL